MSLAVRSLSEVIGESALTDVDIRAALQSRIEQFNARLEHYEKVHKFIVMKDDFPSEVRSVNIFQKIKVDRKIVAQRYQKEIDEIYLSPPREVLL